MIRPRINGGPIEILRPGAFVEITLPDVNYDNVIVLPAAAVSSDGIAYVVQDSRLVELEVEVVRAVGDQVFVKGDLSAESMIVAEQFPDIGPGISVIPHVVR